MRRTYRASVTVAGAGAQWGIDGELTMGAPTSYNALAVRDGGAVGSYLPHLIVAWASKGTLSSALC